jgi:large subunit ribosomal protein L10
MDVLRAQLAGAVVAPLTTVVGLFTAPLRDLVGVIDARIEQLREQGDTSESNAPTAEATVEEPVAEGETAGADEPAAPAEAPAGAEAEVRNEDDETPSPAGEEPAGDPGQEDR